MQTLQGTQLSRRSVMKMGAAMTGVIAASSFGNSFASAQASSDDTTPSPNVQQTIEQIIQAQGSASHGVFSIGIVRHDIHGVTLHGTPIKSDFLLHGTLAFQTVNGDNSQLKMNCDMCLKAEELVPFIKQLVTNNIVFQAEHQHFYDFQPLVWFVHFRAQGDPATIAKGAKAALNVTSTPFPQSPPSNPQSPLPAQEIGKILGAPPKIRPDGVVLYELPRQDQITLGGLAINPYLNVTTHVHFEPLGSGQNAAAAPDFGMVASEVNKVIGQQLQNGWDIDCLYNQESDEHPQLYWSHNFKTGDSIQLAHELRQAFNLMNLKFM